MASAQPSVQNVEWRRVLASATARVRSSGWRVAQARAEPEATWHLVARRGAQWLVIQVLAPGSSGAERRARRRQLGEEVRLASRRGTMEQWFAHVQPGGHLVFGSDALNGLLWSAAGEDDAAIELRLGIPAAPAPDSGGLDAGDAVAR